MNSTDLNRIETELNIRLPEYYRSTMERYPFEKFLGKSEFSLFDDATAIIELTKFYRAHRPWPAGNNILCIGDDADSAPYYLDLVLGTVTKVKGGNPKNIIVSYQTFLEFLHALDVPYKEMLEQWDELESEPKFVPRSLVWNLLLMMFLIFVFGFGVLFFLNDAFRVFTR